jgi:WD40 repeat protein
MLMWDAATGQQCAALQGCFDLAFSPDSRQAAIAFGVRAEVLDWSTQKEVLRLPGVGERGIERLAWSPDGRLLATAGEERRVRLWDARSGKPVHELRGHTARAHGLAFRSDGQRLATSAADGTVRVWDIQTGREVLCLRGHAFAVRAVAWSADGRRLASAGSDGTIRVWDAETRPEPLILNSPEVRIISGLAFSGDGRQLATFNDVPGLALWQPETGQALSFPEPIKSAKWHWCAVAYPAGLLVVLSAAKDAVEFRDSRTGQLVLTLPEAENGMVFVSSPDGKYLAGSGRTGNVSVWEMQTGRLLFKLTARGPSFSPDSRLLAGGEGNTVKVWELLTGRLHATYTGHAQPVRAVAFRPDGRRLASTGQDWTVRTWDTGTGECLHVLRGHTAWGWSVAWTPDGRRLASASEDCQVRLWDLETGLQVLLLQGHTYPVYRVLFSPDGRRLVSGSRDSTARIWDRGPLPAR